MSAGVWVAGCEAGELVLDLELSCMYSFQSWH